MGQLKTLAAALVAVLALSNIAAGSASATYDLGAPSGSLVGTSTTSQAFSTQTLEIPCESGTLHGIQEGGVEAPAGTWTFSTLRVHPTFAGCEVFGVEASVDTEGCDYTFGTATTATGTYDAEASITVECEEGAAIVITAPFCEITVPGGQTVGFVDFENQANGSGMQDDHVLVHSTANEIDYEGTGLFCNTGGLAEGGTYKGDVTVAGFDTTGKAVGVQVA